MADGVLGLQDVAEELGVHSRHRQGRRHHHQPHRRGLDPHPGHVGQLLHGADGAQQEFVLDFVAAWNKVMSADRFDLA